MYCTRNLKALEVFGDKNPRRMTVGHCVPLVHNDAQNPAYGAPFFYLEWWITSMLGVFLDIETNGLDPFVHIPLEIACKIVDLKRGTLLSEYERVIRSSESDWSHCDSYSLLVNGFRKDEILSGVPKEVVSKEIQELFLTCNIRRGNAFFICQNPSFDRPFFGKIISAYKQEELLWPYHWLDLASMFWAKVLVTEQVVHEFNLNVSKDTIAGRLGLPSEERPHKAMNGVNHLLACYSELLGYPSKST